MMRHILCLLLIGSLRFALLPAAQAAPLAHPTRPGGDEKNLVIYPNPSTGIVHLTIIGQEGKKVELQVLNVIGSVMYRETMTEMDERFTRTLDLSRFANGLYYIKLEGEGLNQISKLVIR